MESTEVVTEEVKKDAVTSSISNLEMAPSLEAAPHLENGSLNHAASSRSIASVASTHSSISNVPQRPPAPVPRAPPRGWPTYFLLSFLYSFLLPGRYIHYHSISSSPPLPPNI
uniref:CTNNB1 binding N-teminal domain-containing protein n=1 Tax=Ascaris lumbricoides TaxID=6252 RepID=A0A0M3I764_ASCLU